MHVPDERIGLLDESNLAEAMAAILGHAREIQRSLDSNCDALECAIQIERSARRLAHLASEPRPVSPAPPNVLPLNATILLPLNPYQAANLLWLLKRVWYQNSDVGIPIDFQGDWTGEIPQVLEPLMLKAGGTFVTTKANDGMNPYTACSWDGKRYAFKKP